MRRSHFETPSCPPWSNPRLRSSPRSCTSNHPHFSSLSSPEYPHLSRSPRVLSSSSGDPCRSSYPCRPDSLIRISFAAAYRPPDNPRNNRLVPVTCWRSSCHPDRRSKTVRSHRRHGNLLSPGIFSICSYFSNSSRLWSFHLCFCQPFHDPSCISCFSRDRARHRAIFSS